MARQIADTLPWRIGSATGEKEPRPKLASITLPAWLCMSTAKPSIGCASAGIGRAINGVARSSRRRVQPFRSAPFNW